MTAPTSPNRRHPMRALATIDPQDPEMTLTVEEWRRCRDSAGEPRIVEPHQQLHAAA